MLVDYGDCSRAKIPGARVIAESLPGVQDFLLGRFCEGGEIRKTPNPLIIIRDHRRDLGLLQHEFRDQDGIRVLSAAPGQIAALQAVPFQKGTAKRGGGQSRIHDDEGLTRDEQAVTPKFGGFCWTLRLRR